MKVIREERDGTAPISFAVIFCIILLTFGFVMISHMFTPAYAATNNMHTAIFMPSPTDELFKIINNRLNGHDVAISFRSTVINQYSYQDRLLLAQSIDTIKEAIKTAKTNSKPIGYIGYDNEADNLDLSTPPSELINPSASTNTASDIVHKAGYKFAATPTRSILLKEYQQVDWIKVDMLIMQLQQTETDQQIFTSTVTQIIPYIKAQNPNIVVFVQVNPAFDSMSHITADIKGINGLIDGVSIVCSTGCTPANLNELLISINPARTQSTITGIDIKKTRDGFDTTDEALYNSDIDITNDVVGEATNDIISPPSFGDEYYSDGLTITQGDIKTTFDISQYNQEIPTQVMVAGQKVNMTFKTFESYNPAAVTHMGLYFIPRGEDMITPNSLASIVYDKNSPTEVSDPNHILSNIMTSLTSDGKFQYTQFSFVPTKSYEKMSFLVRAWNDHHYSTDIRIHDALISTSSLKTLPAGVIKYDNFDDLLTVLEKDQFCKPQIMAHIHSTSDVFQSSDGGQISWLYDTINHAVTLVIVDKSGNEVWGFKQSLERYVPAPKGDYKFMKFTVTQLNRWDENQEENAKHLEATKAMLMALKKGLLGHSNW